MLSVADLISAEAALQVVCRNCRHERFLKARFLSARLGYAGRIDLARFRCSRCQSRDVSLNAAVPELADFKLARMEYFGGVYENKCND